MSYLWICVLIDCSSSILSHRYLSPLTIRKKNSERKFNLLPLWILFLFPWQHNMNQYTQFHNWLLKLRKNVLWLFAQYYWRINIDLDIFYRLISIYRHVVWFYLNWLWFCVGSAILYVMLYVWHTDVFYIFVLKIIIITIIIVKLFYIYSMLQDFGTKKITFPYSLHIWFGTIILYGKYITNLILFFISVKCFWFVDFFLSQTTFLCTCPREAFICGRWQPKSHVILLRRQSFWYFGFMAHIIFKFLREIYLILVAFGIYLNISA
jgi:hypothetical protein